VARLRQRYPSHSEYKVDPANEEFTLSIAEKDVASRKAEKDMSQHEAERRKRLTSLAISDEPAKTQC
jgi:hypothetical protein